MKWTTRAALVAASTLCLAAVAQAAPLYSENFEIDPTPNWTTNSGPGVNSADYFFDYNNLGIPAAPSGAGTRGLKLQANLNPNIAAGLTGPANSSSPGGTYAAGGTFGGVTVSPTGQNFAGDYKLLFDWWGNYNGPVNGGGTGTTQVSQFGIGTAGAATQWIGSASKDSVSFAATLDGGSASDFRAYSSAANTSYAAGNAVYAAPAGAINNSTLYYGTPFPANATAPAAQLAAYPLQTGATAAGVTGFQWNKVEIAKQGTTATWTVNGTLLATIDLTTVTLGGGNILFGDSDTNAGASVDATHPQLLFTLIDNVRVEAVPEPASVMLSALAAIGALAAGRRRRS
jgi:hypothetical protein